MATGYKQDFLDDIIIELPTFSSQLQAEILTDNPKLRDGFIQDYVHYSVVMNKNPLKRSAAVVALNVDQTKLRKTDRKDNWHIDDDIGERHQLDNDYYMGDDNPWDRGHMARRETVAWGNTTKQAQSADDESFYYSNACLQHINLNRDEWQTLEDWVIDLKQDDDGKVSTFSGPIYGEHDRRIQPAGRELALIPAGFFKIVCFKNKVTKQLDVRAFVLFQDAKALKDRKGRRNFDNKTYQVTVTEIQQLTGLIFDQAIIDANPLFSNDENINSALNVTHTPECFEISHPSEIINPNQKRSILKDHIIDVFIAAAMVNPIGVDTDNEWLSVINLSAETVDLSGWSITDNANKPLSIDTVITDASKRLLMPGQSAVIALQSPVRLNNDQDTIKLFDETGARIDRVSYNEAMIESGKPVVFLSPLG